MFVKHIPDNKQNLKKCIMKSFSAVILCRIIGILFVWLLSTNSYYLFAVDSDDYPRATVVSKSKLNVRSGPATTYDLVAQLQPAEEVVVLDVSSHHGGWWLIRTSSGLEGYASSSYLSIVSTASSSSSGFDFMGYLRDNLHGFSFQAIYLSVYAWLYELQLPMALVLLLSLYMVEAGIIYWLRERRKRSPMSPPSAWPVYLVTLFAALLTLPGTLAFLPVLNADIWGKVLYLLLLLSTGCLMLHASWQIKQLGMRGGIHRIDYSPHYQWGRWIGNILWVFMALPFARMWWKACDQLHFIISNVGDGFIQMLVVLAVIGGFNYLLVRYIWPRLIVRYFFQTANQGVVHILSFAFFWGILRFEYDVLDANFHSIIFLLALCVFFVLGFATLAFAWSVMNAVRCANCHSFYTGEVGFNDLGTEYRTSKEWESIDDSSVRQRISGSVVTDAKRLVRTTREVRHWETEHYCYRCGNQWTMHHEMTVGKNSRTLKKEWKEWY